mmetsp:Transcript_4906/g.11614  ORF Transcript_4906/g.11614 Transcript_4906/m.11614 type:complete len:741 (-) Transcript_4906:189-2411(-)|eukprot:s1217_g4.t1
MGATCSDTKPNLEGFGVGRCVPFVTKCPGLAQPHSSSWNDPVKDDLSVAVPPDVDDYDAQVSQQFEDSPIAAGSTSQPNDQPQKMVSLNVLPEEDAPKELPGMRKNKGEEEESVVSFATASWATSGTAASDDHSGRSGSTASDSVKRLKSDKSDKGKSVEDAGAASGTPKPKKKAKAKTKATTSKKDEPSKAILVFETKRGKRTVALTNRPPGFSIRFPPMDVIRVVGPPASTVGIEVGWKLVAWGLSEDDLHSKSTISDTSTLRDSFTNLIKSLPRLEPAGTSAKATEAPSKDDQPGSGEVAAVKPGRWVYELDVTVEKANKLRDADWAPGGGSSDPYCVVAVQGKGKSSFKTKVVQNNRDPVWNHKDKINDMHDGDQLFFEILDHDVVGKHDSLGFASIGWEELQEDGPQSFQLPLESTGKKKAHKESVISVKVTVAKRKLEMGNTLTTHLEGMYKLQVNIISARNLRNADHFMGGGSSDPYCKCYVKGTGKTQYTTRVINDKTDPEWNEHVVVPDFYKDDKLMFEIYDKDVGKKDDFLGKAEIPFSQVAAHGFEGEVRLQDAGVQGKKEVEAFIKLHITSHKRDMQGLAPFHNQRKVAKGGMQYKLEVGILSADGLRIADWMSNSSDPYCVCKVKGKGSGSFKTPVKHKETNPVWMHKDVIEDFYHGDALVFTIKDSDKLKHDDTLGSIQLQTAQLIPHGYEGDLRLRNTGHKDPEKTPTFVSLSIKVLDRRPVTQK